MSSRPSPYLCGDLVQIIGFLEIYEGNFLKYIPPKSCLETYDSFSVCRALDVLNSFLHRNILSCVI